MKKTFLLVVFILIACTSEKKDLELKVMNLTTSEIHSKIRKELDEGIQGHFNSKEAYYKLLKSKTIIEVNEVSLNDQTASIDITVFMVPREVRSSMIGIINSVNEDKGFVFNSSDAFKETFKQLNLNPDQREIIKKHFFFEKNTSGWKLKADK